MDCKIVVFFKTLNSRMESHMQFQRKTLKKTNQSKVEKDKDGIVISTISIQENKREKSVSNVPNNMREKRYKKGRMNTRVKKLYFLYYYLHFGVGHL
jgi:hypothetical protein